MTWHPSPEVIAEPTWRAALREAVRPRALRRTCAAAAIVGTTLVVANLGQRLLSEPTSLDLAVKVFLTYAVPWGNATVGVALGLREQVR